MSEIEDLCSMMGNVAFNENHYNLLVENRQKLIEGVPREFVSFFLEDNDRIIQEYLACIDLSNITFLKDMMSIYLNMNKKRDKLSILLDIYNCIYEIINSNKN